MIQDIKILIIVLTLGSFAFLLGQKFWLAAIPLEDFRRRRNVWYILTALVFLSPSFWIFCLIATPVIVWAAQRDSNPLALYVLLLHIIPPVTFTVPMIGINYLFQINNYRLLALTILLPYLLKIPSTANPSRRNTPGFGLPYFLIFCFIAIQIVQLIPFEDVTNTFRRIFITALDCIIVVLAFSRGASSKGKIQDILITFLLVLAVTAPIAIFEAVRGWVLYQNIMDRWGAPLVRAYLMRGDLLRSQVSAGHAMSLGYLMAIAFGIWIYLSKSLKLSKFQLIAGSGWIWTGLIAAYTRSSWLTAILIMFAFAFFMPRGTTKVFKMGIIGLVLTSIVLATPFGEKIIDNLPFIGTVDSENVIYRQRLAEASWDLVEHYPWFGTPHALNYLEHLRQGEGIIDLVNVYASIAIFHGIIGLILFCGYFLTSLYRTWKNMVLYRESDIEISMLGAILIALLLGTLFFMASGSFSNGQAQMAWILSALGLAYSRLPAPNNKPLQG